MTSPLSRHLRTIAEGLSDPHEKESVISAADLLDAKPAASCSADIVERLRAGADDAELLSYGLIQDAADEIERLRHPAQAVSIRLEARPADDSQDWTEIFPAQLEWVARGGHQVRAIEIAAQPPAAPVETVRDQAHRDAISPSGGKMFNAQSSAATDDLIERLRNPMWAHSTAPFLSPQLEQEENLAAMSEAAAEIERLRALPQTLREPCDGADDLEHLDGMFDDRERG